MKPRIRGGGGSPPRPLPEKHRRQDDNNIYDIYIALIVGPWQIWFSGALLIETCCAVSVLQERGCAGIVAFLFPAKLT